MTTKSCSESYQNELLEHYGEKYLQVERMIYKARASTSICHVYETYLALNRPFETMRMERGTYDERVTWLDSIDGARCSRGPGSMYTD